MHPTHHDILNTGDREGVKMIKYYYAGDPHSHIPSLATSHPG